MSGLCESVCRISKQRRVSRCELIEQVLRDVVSIDVRLDDTVMIIIRDGSEKYEKKLKENFVYLMYDKPNLETQIRYISNGFIERVDDMFASSVVEFNYFLYVISDKNLRNLTMHLSILMAEVELNCPSDIIADQISDKKLYSMLKNIDNAKDSDLKFITEVLMSISLERTS